MHVAEIETIKLTDGSKVYNIILRDGMTRCCRLECESADSAMAILDAINHGIIGIVKL